MSYACSEALQRALYARLSADTAVADATGGAVFDAAPAGAVPDVYVTLGPEDVRDISAVDVGIGDHRLRVEVVARTDGFARAKRAAAAVQAALAAPLDLDRGRVAGMRFERARARRARAAEVRAIEMTFRARVEDAGTTTQQT